MVEAWMLPFSILRRQILSLAIPLLPLLFILISFMYLSGDMHLSSALDVSDKLFGGNLYLSATDLQKYDVLGANALFPIMRLGGITKEANLSQVFLNNPLETAKVTLIFLAIFFGYLCYAVVSRIVFELKMGAEHSQGLLGINPATVAMSFLAAIVVLFISSFSLQGFQIVLLLNFGVFFVLAMPLAAAGAAFGESFYKAFEFMRLNLRDVVRMYLLCAGVAVSVPIGLMIIFMFPLSVLSGPATVYAKIMVMLLGLSFALFYQYVVCSRLVLDWSRKTDVRVPAFTKIGKRVR
jgi:hypothetical protein